MKKGDKGEDVKKVQALLQRAGFTIFVDGHFGNDTESIVTRFQKKHGLTPDGIVGSKTRAVLDQYQEKDNNLFKAIKQSAYELNLKPAAMLAVYKVEAAGDGFLKSGRVKILFEGHHFWKYLEKSGIDPTIYSEDPHYKNIVYKHWSRTKYYGGEREHDRYKLAQTINKWAAQMSTSFGAFQIMGFNHKLCGFKHVEDYVASMEASEYEQLMSFARYLKSRKLDVLLREEKWADFARKYNGPGYAKNKYDVKLKKAFEYYEKSA